MPGLGKLLNSYGAKPSSVPQTRGGAARSGRGHRTRRRRARGGEPGTVLFDFKRRAEVVTTLLDGVLVATTQVAVPDDVERLTRQWGKLLTVVRADMERLSANPRHFRLVLEYSMLGVRNPGIRRKVRVGLETYRARLLALAEEVLHGAARPPANASTASTPATLSTAEGLAGVAVSLVHGCALQAVIDPKRFDADQHFDAAARLLDAWGHPPNGRQSMDAPWP